MALFAVLQQLPLLDVKKVSMDSKSRESFQLVAQPPGEVQLAPVHLRFTGADEGISLAWVDSICANRARLEVIKQVHAYNVALPRTLNAQCASDTHDLQRRLLQPVLISFPAILCKRPSSSEPEVGTVAVLVNGIEFIPKGAVVHGSACVICDTYSILGW